MIIFTVGLIVLVAALAVNMLDGLKKKRVLIMSILAILMIMINFINEIDIAVSSVQFTVKTEFSRDKVGLKSIVEIAFTQKPTSKDLNEQIIKIYQELSQQTLQSEQSLKQQQKKSLSQFSNILINEHCKPIIKEQIYLIELLKNKIINQEDQILYIDGVDPLRFDLLIRSFLEQTNHKKTSYGLKSDRILITLIYEDEKEQKNSNTHFSFSQKFSERDYHYIVIFGQPSENLVNFLYESYASGRGPQNLTIIFLNLNENINLSPMSPLIEQISFPSDASYLQPIADYLLANYQTKGGKTNKFLVNKIYKQLEICQKYLEINYKLFLHLIFQKVFKSVSRICYEILDQPLSKDMQCLRMFTVKQNQQLSYYKAKQCFEGSEPEGVIRTSRDTIKLPKQYYWQNKLTQKDFELESVTKGKPPSNQL